MSKVVLYSGHVVEAMTGTIKIMYSPASRVREVPGDIMGDLIRTSCWKRA